MRSKLSLAFALSLLLVFSSVPAFADPPIMEYLTGTIKPLLDTIFAGVGSLRTSMLQVLSDTGAVRSTVDRQPKLLIVSRKFTSMPSSITPFVLDGNSIPAGDFMKVKRYTVSVVIVGSLVGLPAGTDTLRLENCVLDSALGTCLEATVAETDPAVSRKIISGPYAGTHSLVRFHRGADGLGPLDVLVNAYIETQP